MNKLNPSAILTSTVEKLSMASSLPAITQIVAEAARNLSGADGTTFVLRDGDKCYYADENAISPLWKGKRFPAQVCVSGWAMMHKETVLIPDIYQDARVPHDAYQPTFVKSLCMVPVREQNPIAAIGNYWAREHTPSPEEIKLLQILANSVAVALENFDLKKSIQQHSKETDVLRDRASELETALHTMAHDLRNPISAMMGLSELLTLQIGESIDPMVRNYLQAMTETGKRAGLQIERMLALYRVSNGQLAKQNINLSDMTMQVLAELKNQFPNREIKLEVEPELVTYADGPMVHMVLENLLSNALKYSSKKPTTQIQVGAADRKQGFTTFYVRDNGDGFDGNKAHLLFRPLSRLHDESEFAGTGLGLASVARIIEVHGGEVRADGKKSEGATFYFSLPAAC